MSVVAFWPPPEWDAMLPTMASMDEWQQRAVDNERLRRLAVSELESTRDQLADKQLRALSVVGADPVGRGTRGYGRYSAHLAVARA